jgi:putative tryptophan/tyrosine transport system substrate-binding protein
MRLFEPIPLRRLLVMAPLALIAGNSALGRSVSPVVWVVSSARDGIHEQARMVLRADVSKGMVSPIEWEEMGLPLTVDAATRPPALILTLGVAAWRAVADRIGGQDPHLARIPVVAALLPRVGYESVRAAAPAVLSSTAIFLDQPVDRFLELLRQSMPERRRVGVLWGPVSKTLVLSLQSAATARGMELVEASLPDQVRPENIHQALSEVLSRADVLLALPDSTVFNAASLQYILIAAYRQRKPVVSYSLAHAQAGATLALHLSVEQAAAQAAGVVRNILQGRPLPLPAMARSYTVEVNQQVARSLGLPLLDARALEEAIRRQEAVR